MQLKLENETSLFTSELNTLKSDAIIQTKRRAKTPAGHVDQMLKEKIMKIKKHSTFKEDFKLFISIAKDIDAIIIDTTQDLVSTFAQKWVFG